MFGYAISDFAAPLGKHLAIFAFKLKTDFLAFPESDIKAARIEDFAELDMDGAHNVIGVQAGADCLPDLRQEFVFFASATRFMELNIMVQCGAKLSGQAL